MFPNFPKGRDEPKKGRDELKQRLKHGLKQGQKQDGQQGLKQDDQHGLKQDGQQGLNQDNQQDGQHGQKQDGQQGLKQDGQQGLNQDNQQELKQDDQQELKQDDQHGLKQDDQQSLELDDRQSLKEFPLGEMSKDVQGLLQQLQQLKRGPKPVQEWKNGVLRLLDTKTITLAHSKSGPSLPKSHQPTPNPDKKKPESKKPPPKYAILSHRWSDEEVSFQEIQDLTRETKEKQGYKKIKQFCSKAKENEILYAWVDTCCIDKSSSAELSQSINSMFEWYKDAVECYVYLADVSARSDLKLRKELNGLESKRLELEKEKLGKEKDELRKEEEELGKKEEELGMKKEELGKEKEELGKEKRLKFKKKK
jgi:hypothetical protein